MSSYFEERLFINPVRDHMFLSGISGIRKFKNGVSLSGGLCFVRFALPHDPTVEDISVKLELRPTQSIGYSFFQNSKWKIFGRSMLEERFFKSNFAHDHFTYFSMRLRNRLNVMYQLTDKVSILVFDDHVIHYGDQVPSLFDQNRASCSIFYKLSPHLKFEVGYLNWYQRRKDPGVYVMRHSWKMAFVHNL